jgi:hypothetical protein
MDAQKEEMMSKSIWKFPIKVVDRQVINMPGDAKLLTVQVQGGGSVSLGARRAQRASPRP